MVHRAPRADADARAGVYAVGLAPYFVQDSLSGQVGTPPRYAAVAIADIVRLEERGGRDGSAMSEPAKIGLFVLGVLAVGVLFVFKSLVDGTYGT
jgi:hypothetical protein